MSGVLNKALAALAAIRKRRGLSESESISKAGKEFVRLTDPVAVWLDAKTAKDSDAMVAKKSLLDAYNEDARHENRPPITGTALGLAVRRLFPDVEGGQRRLSKSAAEATTERTKVHETSRRSERNCRHPKQGFIE